MKAISENTILGRLYGPRGRAREEENEEEKETLHNEVHYMYISYNSVSDYIYLFSIKSSRADSHVKV
jgi:hypothetical protein